MPELENLLGAIKTVKPKTALFTTFTVSLSFIDAVLLPQLRQVGCKDIFVLVDVNQANRSLAESSSQYAGRHYWVASVTAPGGGCFHPKLAYLRGEDEDVLAVGSGNLTHPGQGGQLEVLDLVTSKREPQVFKQFSSFASELAKRLGRDGTNAAEFLREHAERAANLTRGVPEGPSNGPTLIHTLTTAASEQIARLWREQAVEADSLVALTPFHAPDGGPLQRLAREVGAQKVRLGLDSHTRVAPFERGRLAGWKPEFVVPVFAERDRPLHAKVFEISGKEHTLVVTGSVNGTAQSLETSKNVEVSLARWLPKGAFEWESATPAKYSPNVFAGADLGPPDYVVQATLEPDGAVLGMLTCTRGGLPKSASVTLWREDETIAPPRAVVVPPSGAFEFRLDKGLESPAGVQLQLDIGSASVRCWLNVAEDLRSSNQERRERQAVRNLLQGHFSEEDVYELLSMLTRAAQGNSKPMRGGAKKPAPSQEPANEEAKFDYDRWRSGLQETSTGLRSLAGRQTVDALVAWLTRGGDTPKEGGQDGGSPPVRGGRREFRLLAENTGNGSKKDVRAQFDTLLSLIPKTLAKEPAPAEAGVLAMVAGAAAVVLMVRDAATHPWPLGRVTEWLDQYSRFKYPPSDIQPVCEFALCAAALVMAVAEMRGLTTPASAMKEALYRLKDRWTPEDAAAEAMREHLSAKAFRQASPALLERAAVLAPAVLQAEAMNDVLLRIATRARNRDAEPHKDDEATFPGLFQAVKKHFQGRPVIGKAGGVFSTDKELQAGGCFHCSHSLGDEGRRALSKRHVAICPSCRRPTFYVTDTAAAEQLRSVLRHA